MTCFRLKSGETLYSYCKRTNTKYITMQNRCDRLGMTPDEALVAPPRQYKYRFMHLGEPLKLFCKRTGMNYCSIMNRVRRNKETVEEAVQHFKERSKRWTSKWQR